MIEIPLTQGQVALIDDEDYELVSQYKWRSKWEAHTKSYYAVTNVHKPDGSETTLSMHRLVINAKKGEQVDHISHHTLDNQKENLRICTHSENQHNQGMRVNNTSGYKGVSFDKKSKKWRANIVMLGKQIRLGYFNTPEEAYAAYCKAAYAIHGEFAKVD